NWQILPQTRLPNFEFNQLALNLRFSAKRQLGVFPEQMPNWQWLQNYLADLSSPLEIFNGFAYTGAASIAAASQNLQHQVTHLDAAKSSLNWAKANFQLSLPQNDNIRWISDDILTFLQREKKRHHLYDGFILDPPAFGRAGKTTWKIERDLPKLLKISSELLSSNPRFIILSCHHPHLQAADLAKMLKKMGNLPPGQLEEFPLTIKAQHGNDLPAGACVRWSR
ncbi:MAG: class I SAM-dependent methyltransferase, partial [Candidatus Cloacimonadales bacterium]